MQSFNQEFTLKVRGHSKKLTLLSSPIARTHSAFLLMKVSAFEVPDILQKFVTKEVTLEGTILNLSRQSGPGLCGIILSGLKLAERRKTCK